MRRWWGMREMGEERRTALEEAAEGRTVTLSDRSPLLASNPFISPIRHYPLIPLAGTVGLNA
jgi:hypothetical protein